MFLSTVRREILGTLRHQPRDQFQIVADTGRAPFTIRAELQALKRERLVVEVLDTRAHKWALTARGLEQSLACDQIELLR